MPTLAPSRPRPDTAARILDSAFQCILDAGLGRTTVEDVAKTAGLARQTIYRYFPSKDHLIMALVIREEEKFLDGVRAAFDATPDLGRAMERAMLFCLTFAREHPLLDRLLASDPETLLPYLTTRAGPIMRRARDVLAQLLSSKAWVRADVLEQATDMVVRVTISYAMTPPERDAREVARDLGRILQIALTGKEGTRR
jgi:TetR/AcrR family transcriptional regulator, repressor for uid operon